MRRVSIDPGEVGRPPDQTRAPVAANDAGSLGAFPPTPRTRRLRRHLANMGLWTAQGWLAMFFIAAGWAKVSQPVAVIQDLLVWPAYVGAPFVRLVGMVEAVLALAMLAPLISWSFGPAMVAAARTLLSLTLVATGIHLALNMPVFAGLNAVLAGLCLSLIRGPAANLSDRA